MKTACTLQALFQYAGELGKARQSGDPERIAKAQEAHDSYVALCLEADVMLWGITVGELSRLERGIGCERLSRTQRHDGD